MKRCVFCSHCLIANYCSSLGVCSRVIAVGSVFLRSSLSSSRDLSKGCVGGLLSSGGVEELPFH